MSNVTALSADQAPRSGWTPAAYHRTHAVVLLEPEQVRFNDYVVDSWSGQILVEEIVHRTPFRGPVYEFAGRGGRRVAGRNEGSRLLRVARDIGHFQREPGHLKRVHSHNPRKVGCYTHVDGWAAACSCGWPTAEPLVRSREKDASALWEQHKAMVITERALDGHRGLDLIVCTEAESRALPPLPWTFDARGGIAHGRLDGLALPQARAVAHAWATAFGVEVSERPIVSTGAEDGGVEINVRARTVTPDGGRGEFAVLLGGFIPDVARMAA